MADNKYPSLILCTCARMRRLVKLEKMIGREIATTYETTMTIIDRLRELWQKIKARPHSLHVDEKVLENLGQASKLNNVDGTNMIQSGLIICQKIQSSLSIFETILEEDCYDNESVGHTKQFYGVRLDKGEFTPIEVYFVPIQKEDQSWLGSFVIKFGSNITAFEKGTSKITPSKNKWNIEYNNFLTDPTRHSYVLTVQNGNKVSHARCNMLLGLSEEMLGFCLSNEGKLRKGWYYNNYDEIYANIYVTETTLSDRDVNAIASLTPQVLKSMLILSSLRDNKSTGTELFDIFLRLDELSRRLVLPCYVSIATEKVGKNVSGGIDFIDENETTTCSVHFICEESVGEGRIQLIPRYVTEIIVYSNATDIEKSLKENGVKNLLKLKHKLDVQISNIMQDKKIENLEL